MNASTRIDFQALCTAIDSCRLIVDSSGTQRDIKGEALG